jgi:hypothetical protein
MHYASFVVALSAALEWVDACTHFEREGKPMSLFMDIHTLPGATIEAVAGAHQKDLEIQAQYGVKYLNYRFDASTGRVFCLAEAPSAEAATRVHREAHGLVPDEIFEVTEAS